MKHALLLALGLSACSPSPLPKPYGSDLPALDAHGLPPQYSLCVRNRSVKSAAIFDVYYGCQGEIVSYLAGMPNLTQQEKALLRGDMEKRAVSYAHETVVDRHGAEAVRRTIEPPPAAPSPAAAPREEGPVIVDQQIAPRSELRF